MMDIDLGITEPDSLYVMHRGFCCVYAFRWAGSVYVKIGRSRNLYQRARTFLSACPNQLTLDDLAWVRTEKASISLEAALHLHFADSRHRGEWFESSKIEVMDAFELQQCRRPDIFSSMGVVEAARGSLVRQKFDYGKELPASPQTRRELNLARESVPERERLRLPPAVVYVPTAPIIGKTTPRPRSSRVRLADTMRPLTPEELEIKAGWDRWRASQ